MPKFQRTTTGAFLFVHERGRWSGVSRDHLLRAADGAPDREVDILGTNRGGRTVPHIGGEER